MKNSLCVLGLRLTMKLRYIFITIFVTLYMWDLSNGSIAIISQFYMSYVVMIFIAMTAGAYTLSTHKNRKLLLNLGNILQFVYLLLVYKLGAQCINYAVLLGMLNGMAEGTYYCIYNIYETEGISNESRTKVMGIYYAINAIVSVIFPIAAGFVIDNFGMETGLLVVLAIIFISIVISLIYKDNGTSIGHKFSIKTLFNRLNTKDDKQKLVTAIKLNFCKGFLNSTGSFELFTSILIMTLFTTATNVGSVSGISTAFQVIFSLTFAKWAAKMHKANMSILNFLQALTIFAMSMVVLNTNTSVYWLFIMNLAIRCSYAIESPINACSQANITNQGNIAEYKSEYYLVLDMSLVVSRLTGYIMLLVYGLFNNAITLNICLVVYSTAMIVLPFYTNKLYKIAYSTK